MIVHSITPFGPRSQRGELRADAPVEALVQILRVTLLSCTPMTQDAGSFREIESLFAALDRALLGAWSRPVPTGL